MKFFHFITFSKYTIYTYFMIYCYYTGGDKMDLDISIDEFEGPLDLLLHLIKESKMDIFNIEIEKITDQYLKYIEHQEKLNLEISSGYLVMAAELIEMKSRLLLPRTTVEEEMEEEDPKEDLVARLLEYQAYKEITKTLKEKEEIRKEIYTKAPDNFSQYREEGVSLQGDISLDDLLDAFQKYLRRMQKMKPLKTKVTIKEISVSSRQTDIKKILFKKKKVSFFELFPEFSKEYIVATFLAILEMAKEKELRIVQNNNFDDIICEVVS